MHSILSPKNNHTTKIFLNFSQFSCSSHLRTRMSDLQVDVNGQEIFFVSMKILASFSGKLRKMFGKSANKEKGSFKLIFQDFPNGAEGFELVVRFCYNEGRIDISPSNVLRLHSAARYLEIDQDQTLKCFESVHSWTWLELLDFLKQCQELFPFMDSSGAVQEILNAVVEKISMHSSSSPFDFSCSDFSGTQFSSEMSTNGSSSSSSPTVNWLQDLEFLKTGFFEKTVNAMVSCKLDDGKVCSFLLHYQRVKYYHSSLENKCRIIEVVITCLFSLDEGFMLFPFRNLCHILQACRALKMGRFWEKRVERMIGSRLNEATLDDLMIPCHGRKKCAYDVNLVLRFLKFFLGEGRKSFIAPSLERAGFLMDSYLAEVAPDPQLRPKKFLALALALPDSARESFDTFCEVLHLYFKVHGFMREEEKIKICSVLNWDKLSKESLVNLASNNAEFPACVSSAALEILDSKFKNMVNEVENLEFRLNSSLHANEDEIVVDLSKGKECRKVEKIYLDVAKVCAKSSKSLPRLCS